MYLLHRWQVTYNKAKKQQNLFNQSHRIHITPLVIRTLRVDAHTKMHTLHLHSGQHALGLKTHCVYTIYSCIIINLYDDITVTALNRLQCNTITIGTRAKTLIKVSLVLNISS